jgi:hypothetical protein
VGSTTVGATLASPSKLVGTTWPLVDAVHTPSAAHPESMKTMTIAMESTAPEERRTLVMVMMAPHR